MSDGTGDGTFRFWTRWLTAASVGFCLLGVGLAAWPDAPPLRPWNDRVAALAPGAGGGAEVRRFLMGPLGGTIAGFYLLQAAIAAVPFARRERWAWWATAGGTLLWFAVDSAASVARGAAFNIWMVNLAPLLLFAPPLLATRRAFFGEG